MGHHWKVAANDYLSSHLGVISANRLIGLGCPSRTLANLVSDGQLITMLPGVYRSAQWPCNREQILAAICARNLAAMIGFTTAGQLWAQRRMSDPNIHVLVPHGCSPEMEGVVVHRCRRIDPVDLVQRPDGIRLSSPPRTIFDCADMIGFEATTSVLEQLLNEQKVTFGTISDTVHRLYHPQRPAREPCSQQSAADPHGERLCNPISRSRCWKKCLARACPCRRLSSRCVFPTATSSSTSHGRRSSWRSRSIIRLARRRG